MMKEILITSSALILALLVLRRVFRGALSRRVQYALWGLVLLRLLFPVSLLPASDFSVLTATAPVQQAVAERVNLDRIFYSQPQGQVSREELEERNIDPDDVPTAQDLFVLGESDPDNRFSTNWLVRDPESGAVTRYAEMTVGPWDFLDAVWKAGMVLMGGFFLLSNLGFYLRLRKNRREWRADEDIGPYQPLSPVGADVPIGPALARKVYVVPDGVIPSPCLFGRSIYITPAVTEDCARLRHVLAHESTHARHWDPVWSLLRCLCLTVYWFDPLVWIAARCSKTDCELACDESVLEALGEAERIPYGQTLLSLIPVKRVSNPMIAATTMTAGKKQLKDRITRIAQKPRQLAAAAIAVALLAGVVSACTFTGGTSGESVAPELSNLSQGPTESALRSLTGEELRWFNEEFFNHNENPAISYTYSIRNQFINAEFNLYESPENIDLYELFYVDGSILSDAEYQAVFGNEEMMCPAYKMTTGEMDEILKQYTGLTLAQTNMVGLENFTYQDGAYYWMHGDTNYPGDIEILCGTWEGDTVRLYHHGWSSGSEWYCTTLKDRADEGESRYWFVSNMECETPAIPVPLPAWEPEATVSLAELKPYAAPTVTVTDYPNHYSYSYQTSYANWDIDGHHIVVYKAADDVIYAAYEENDVYHIFQSGLPENHGCVSFYSDLLGQDGFWLDYDDPYDGGANFWPVRDYYYFDGGGVLTLLARCETGYDGKEPSVLDLNGDGKQELVCSRQLFFEREGTVYEVRLEELVKTACPELTGRWELTVDKYSKCLRVYGYTEDYKEVVRYLYFDGKSLLVYKNNKPTTDHMVDGADEGVPAAVVEAARDFAREQFEQPGVPDSDFNYSQPASYDDWRVDYFTGPCTYSYGGATVEGWWFNYELHTTTPENIVLAGGRYLTEDDWISPGYPGCDALFFEVKDGSYRLLGSRMAQESPKSYYMNEQVLRMMEEKGVELTDGSTYAGLLFQMRLGHVTGTYYDYANPDGVEMQLQYDDGQGYGGSHIVHPHEDNGPYYLGQMKDNYVIWSRAQAPAAPPTGATVILSDPHWYDMLQFWQDSGLVMYKEQNQEPEWYEVRYDGDPAEDVFSYRAVPYYWARCWFDDAEYERYANTALGDHGDGNYREVALAYLTLYEEAAKRNATPGSRFACTYVKVTDLEILEDQPESWFPADIVGYPHFCFSYRVVFVPENEDALNTLMAGNTGEYEGNDPDVPQGAFEYSRMGAMYLKDGYWYCAGIGTG